MNSKFIRAFDFAVEGSLKRFMSPLPIIWKIERFLNIGSERKYREAIKVIDEFTMNIIRSKEIALEEQEDVKEEKLDLLSRFMGSSSNLGFGDEDEKRKFLRDIVISFILAGMQSIIWKYCVCCS